MIRNYDSKLVAVIFGGPITGFADGTFVTVEYNEDAFTLQMGADGINNTRSKTNNSSGKVTVTLSQSSPSNAVLSAFHKADKLAPFGAGVKPLTVKDISGTSLHFAPTAWIVKAATSEYAKEAGSREWVFETDALDSFVGGLIA